MINFSGYANLVTTTKDLQSTKNVGNYVPQRNPTQAHSQLGEILSEWLFLFPWRCFLQQVLISSKIRTFLKMSNPTLCKCVKINLVLNGGPLRKQCF